jgi:hypothetical protein
MIAASLGASRHPTAQGSEDGQMFAMLLLAERDRMHRTVSASPQETNAFPTRLEPV